MTITRNDVDKRIYTCSYKYLHTIQITPKIILAVLPMKKGNDDTYCSRLSYSIVYDS